MILFQLTDNSIGLEVVEERAIETLKDSHHFLSHLHNGLKEWLEEAYDAERLLRNLRTSDCYQQYTPIKRRIKRTWPEFLMEFLLVLY